MGLKDRLVDPRSPDRRPRRAAYALPTLFTAGNIFLGYISILRSFQGAMLAASGAGGAPEHFAIAAKAIGAAVLLDGLDGRIARMTNTTSDFGREMDSLADVISFGMAPGRPGLRLGRAVRRSVPGRAHSRHNSSTPATSSRSSSCCAAPRGWRASTSRRTRFPRIPAGPTASISSACPFPPPPAWWPAVVYASDGEPLTWWPLSVAWLVLLALLGFLMVSTWRYYSFKGISLSKPYTPLIIIAGGRRSSTPSGISRSRCCWPWRQLRGQRHLIRIGGIVRRRLRPRASSSHPGAPDWLNVPRYRPGRQRIAARPRDPRHRRHLRARDSICA